MSAEVPLLARKIVCDLSLDVIVSRLMLQRLAAKVTDESGDCSASSTMGLNRYNVCRRICVHVVAGDNIYIPVCSPVINGRVGAFNSLGKTTATSLHLCVLPFLQSFFL